MFLEAVIVYSFESPLIVAEPRRGPEAEFNLTSILPVEVDDAVITNCETPSVKLTFAVPAEPFGVIFTAVLLGVINAPLSIEAVVASTLVYGSTFVAGGFTGGFSPAAAACHPSSVTWPPFASK